MQTRHLGWWLALWLVACATPTQLPHTPAPTWTVPFVTMTAPAPELSPPASRVPPSAIPLPTVTAALAPSATPSGWLGPANFPPNINPLTGQTVADPASLEHRPLAVKVVNAPPCARPQFGLNRAALVFEHYVEAWSTRFTAIFYGDDPPKIGAVRSARLVDLELPAIFEAMLVTSGSSGGVKARLLASDFAPRIISAEFGADCPPLCRVPIESVACKDAEHTMFTTAPDLHAAAAEAGQDARPALSGWAFSEAPAPGGLPADKLHVGYLNAPVDWTYDPASGRYLRSQNGTRQVDALDKQRLTASNVVVVFAHHLYSDIRESSNFYSLEIQFWGQGPVRVFRDGQMLEGLWLRPQRAGLFGLVDATGAVLPLKPGRTWFEFAPLDSVIEMSEGHWAIEATILPQQTPPKP